MTDTLTIHQLYSILEREISKFPKPMAKQVWEGTHNKLQTLIAIMLSARTKDSLTVSLLPKVFEAIKSVADLEKLSVTQIERLIYPVGFYKNKAKFLKSWPKRIKNEFAGEIPQEFDMLLKLSGVGRKTANLYIAIVHKIPAISVDTHVHRIMNKIGYVKTKTPLETEKALIKKLPKELWIKTNEIFVVVGQYLCPSKKIDDPECLLNKIKLV